jgi:hypothetical protein
MRGGLGLIVALAVAATFVQVPITTAQAQQQPPHTIDRQLVGVWEAVIPTPQGGELHMRSHNDPDGTVVITFPGTTLPPLVGVMSANNGVWASVAATGSDGGSYTFTNPNQVTMAGRLGPPVTWQRVSD